MGVYADLLSDAISWDTSSPVATDRIITEEIEAIQANGDPSYPSGYSEADEVQNIATYNGTVSGGNFTLTFALGPSGSVTFTTANIAHNANAATIEAAIDTAANGVVTSWTDGDITVTGGDLTTNDVTLTYDGNSVDATNHQAVVINDVDLSGGGTVGDVTTTTNGQTKRTTMAALNLLGIVTTLPPQGTATGLVASFSREAKPHAPSQVTLVALAKEASVQDGSAELYTQLMRAMGFCALL